MPKRLIVLNAVLLALAAGGTVYIVRQLTSPMPMPQAGRGRPAPPAPSPAEVPPPSPGGYASVAARNLFSPTRTESPPAPTVAASPAVKPNLFGVVLREGAPIAYLEDPNTKRVAGYRVGDSVAGGTVQTINSEGIVINRPDGNMDVRLRDPSKPRLTSLSDFSMVMVLADEAQDVQGWMEQVHRSARQVPFGFLLPAETTPVVQPYLSQAGIFHLAGKQGALAYQSLRGDSGMPTAQIARETTQQRLSMLVFIVLLLVGAVIVGTSTAARRRGSA